MKMMLMTALALGSATIAAAPAEARQGCGPGFHRGYHGRCIANRGPRFVRGGPVVHRFYPGRGYWYGGRYWGHRYRWHGGWRYR